MSRKQIFVVLFALAACSLLLPFSQSILWIGSFEFTIHLHSHNAAPIKTVRYATAARDPKRSRVEEYVWDDLRKANDVDDSSVYIPVKCTGNANGWGWEHSYGEHGRVLLQVEFEDGTTVRKLVDIPPGRGPRETTVDVP